MMCVSDVSDTCCVLTRNIVEGEIVLTKHVTINNNVAGNCVIQHISTKDVRLMGLIVVFYTLIEITNERRR